MARVDRSSPDRLESCMARPSIPPRRRRFAAIAVAVGCALAAPAHAVDKGRALQTMTAEAGRAYE
ncbi:MAG: hypothetical protein RIT45_2042, partial [Pseudomonadota bacterium]